MGARCMKPRIQNNHLKQIKNYPMKTDWRLTRRITDDTATPGLPLRIVVFLMAALCMACAAKGPKATTNALQLSLAPADADSVLEVAEINRQLFTAFTAAPNYEDYVIGGGDLLQVAIFEAPGLNTETRVSARGSVTLPLLNAVNVAGLSVRDAEQHVEGLYRENYLRDPHVTIFVKEQFGSKITLMGALRKPGTYDFYARMNIMDVLALGEGLSDNAGRIVQVRRRDGAGQPDRATIIDLDEMIKNGRDELNIAVRGGDVVYVPEAGSVYVDGAVRKAGSYPIRREMSVQEAIVAAGGLESFADAGNVKLVRYVRDGRRQVARLSLDGEGEEEAHGLKVQDRDVIFVESSPTSAFFQGLRLTLGTGLLGVGYTPPSR